MGCLFQLTIPDDCSGWVFWMPISDDCRTPPNDCFWLLFQTNISDTCFKWLFRMTVRNSTTDSYFSGQSVFPRPIPISNYYSTDWSHDWFVFEWQLPTAELWPRSPLITFFFQKQSHIFSFNRVQKQSLISFKSSHAFIKKH